ncbi:unnamed protein product, partial [Mesorhabditis spiculigera]
MLRQALLLVILASCVFAACKFSRGKVHSSWKVSNGRVTISFENSGIDEREFTGIAFGESMYNLEFVLFKIVNGKATVETGATNDYAPPERLDSSPAVRVEELQWDDGRLSATISRPIGSAGPRRHSLEEPQNWNFISVGDVEVADRGNGPEHLIGAHRSRPETILVDLSSC